jgi:hypothetical protein
MRRLIWVTRSTCLLAVLGVLAVFRCILGRAVGGASAIVPYQSEMSPFERRDSVVTRNEVMIVKGRSVGSAFECEPDRGEEVVRGGR